MRVVYIADNGTEFETEQECIEYETPLDEYKVAALKELWDNSPFASPAEFILKEFSKITEIVKE